MSLIRVYTTLAQTLIRKLGDSGGPPSGRVDEELNRIIAWAKDAPRCIGRNFAIAGSAAGAPGALTSLHSFPLPANSLATNGDWVRATHSGVLAPTAANNKRLLESFGGQTVHDTTLLDVDGGVGWKTVAEYIRLSATSVYASMSIVFGFVQINGAGANGGNGGRIIVASLNLTVANLNSNPMTILTQGQGTTLNDVTQNGSIIELCQQ